MKSLWGVALFLVACGPGLKQAPKPNPTVDFASGFAHASQTGDIATLRAMLGPSVTVGGLWFPDPICEREFVAPGEIGGGRLDEFARCLTTVKLTVAARKDSLPDVAVLTYEPGLEVEARFIDRPEGPWLSWIGFEARRSVADALPTISPDTLESLRAAGQREPTVTGLEQDITSHASHYAHAWTKVCLDATGKVTGTHVRQASSGRAARTFTAAIADWAFRPFAPNGTPIPVCSLVLLGSPLAVALDHEKIPFPLRETAEGTLIVAPTAMRRLKGEKLIVPSDDEKVVVAKVGSPRLIGMFQFCIDTTGHVGEVRMLRSTGLPGYDQQIQRKVAAWEYEPYLDEGKPVPVCTAVTFVYSQS